MGWVLLIHPPVSKPCEPPAGIARLAGFLGEQGVPCEVVDANTEGLHFLLHAALRGETARHGENDVPGGEGGRGNPGAGKTGGGLCPTAGDTWTKRARRNLTHHLRDLRSRAIYGQRDRYRRAVADLGRILACLTPRPEIAVGLADYQDGGLSPLRSRDLLFAAAHPERNPFYPYFRERLALRLQAVPPDSLLGISVNYLSQALCAFAMIGFLRACRPQARIVLGGSLVTSWMRQPQWRNPFGGLVDHLVAGPGEEPLLALMKNGGLREAHDTGIGAGGYGEGGEGEHPVAAVSCPDYRFFPRELYLAPGLILPYSAATGCYWRRCRFCPETAENNPYRPLPLERVFTDLERLREELQPVLVHFLDNALSPALLTALSRRPLGVPWYGFARITERLADPGFCRRLRHSGCVMLKLGLESGDQQVLNALDKGIEVATAARVLRSLKEAGIAAYVYLLFGTPAEDREAARRTLEFVAAHSAHIAFLNIAVFNMPVFAAAAAGLPTRCFSAADLSLYLDFTHPRGWNRREVRRFIAGEVRKEPAVAAILKRTPPVFTSNHAPFSAGGGGRFSLPF